MNDAEFDEALVLARGPLSHGGQRLLARALLRSIADRSALVLAERERCANVTAGIAAAALRAAEEITKSPVEGEDPEYERELGRIVAKTLDVATAVIRAGK